MCSLENCSPHLWTFWKMQDWRSRPPPNDSRDELEEKLKKDSLPQTIRPTPVTNRPHHLAALPMMITGKFNTRGSSLESSTIEGRKLRFTQPAEGTAVVPRLANPHSHAVRSIYEKTQTDSYTLVISASCTYNTHRRVHRHSPRLVVLPVSWRYCTPLSRLCNQKPRHH